VAILLQPAAGVRIGQLSAAGQRSLSVPLERSQIGVTPPPSGSTVPVPTPTNNSSQPLPTAPRGRIVVVIDPGHGGPDPGAVGINGLSEVDIVDPISQEVASLLERQGVQAILTRRDNIDLGLEPRVALAERVNATLFVSIHANAISMSRPDVNGLETYYYASGERLARTIHSAMLQETGARDRGVRQARFYVLRRTSMPAVLIETGFVTGSEDAANLSRPEYRSRLAAAIARGILQYIQQNY
jgi:N-acetylmuramoyl-L-alanine amidase